MQVRRSERFTILITRQAVTDGRTRSAALLAMMIQADVTSDSSLLRATCENRLRPMRCQGGLGRTEAQAQCSIWAAFARYCELMGYPERERYSQVRCELRRAGSRYTP